MHGRIDPRRAKMRVAILPLLVVYFPSLKIERGVVLLVAAATVVVVLVVVTVDTE